MPPSPEFPNDPRERDRDRYYRDRSGCRCANCGRKTARVGRNLHHRDGDKENGQRGNLETLCPKCHFGAEHDRPEDDHSPDPHAPPGVSATGPPSAGNLGPPR